MTKKSIKTSKAAESLFMGEEPRWGSLDGLTDSEIQIAMLNAFTWYNWRYDPAERCKLIIKYIEATSKKALIKKITKAVNATDGWKISPTACYLARMLTIGTPIPEKDWLYFNDQLGEIIDNAPRVKRVREVSTVPIVSVRERMLEKVSEYIDSVEAVVDKAFDEPITFDMYDWLSENEIKGKPAKLIGDSFIRQRDELAEVVRGQDEQLVEAYRAYTKAQLRTLLKLFQSIVTDCNTWSENSNKGRKPRKKATSSSTRLAAKVGLLDRDDKYKIVSVDPSKVIGASQAWTFNVNTRDLAVYNAGDANGLTLSGSSIRNFDITTSMSKKLRKPDMILSKVRQGSKTALRKIINSIKASEKNVSGRLNNRTVLVRVI